MSHPSHWSQQAGYDAFPKESIGLSACFPQSAAFGGIFFSTMHYVHPFAHEQKAQTLLLLA